MCASPVFLSLFSCLFLIVSESSDHLTCTIFANKTIELSQPRLTCARQAEGLYLAPEHMNSGGRFFFPSASGLRDPDTRGSSGNTAVFSFFHFFQKIDLLRRRLPGRVLSHLRRPGPRRRLDSCKKKGLKMVVRDRNPPKKRIRPAALQLEIVCKIQDNPKR